MIIFKIKQGEHVFSVDFEFANKKENLDIKLKIEPNKKYYINTILKQKFMSYAVYLELISEVLALNKLKSLKISE